MKTFSHWHRFNEIFKYIGLASSDQTEWGINKSIRTLKVGYFIKINEELSQFNTHNGFTLLKDNSEDIKQTSKGLYFLKLFTPELGTRVYIGKSEGKSINSESGVLERLRDHFRKIQVLPSRDRNPSYLEWAKDERFGGKGYKLKWNPIKQTFSKFEEKLTDEDKNINDIKRTHGVVLGNFEDHKSISDSYKKLTNEETNRKWNKFNQELKNEYQEEFFKNTFWNDSCEFSFLLVDDLLNCFTEKDDNQSITQLVTKDIDALETKAIQALRRNFDPDDILNHQKMAEPENICDINKNLHMCNFDLNSVDRACTELIFRNAKYILKKLNNYNLEKLFFEVLESTRDNKNYYLYLTLTGKSDLRIAPTKQRKQIKNFMVFAPTKKYINCKCIMELDELNGFLADNQCKDFVSEIKEDNKKSGNIKSHFKIINLQNTDWVIELMDKCYEIFHKKYSGLRDRDKTKPKYGKG